MAAEPAFTIVPPVAPRVTSYAYGDLLDIVLPPERPLVAGLIGEESAGVIVGGVGGVGKSYMAVEMARCIAAGTPFLGQFPTEQQTVLYLDEESNLRGVIDRAHKLERGNPLGRDIPLYFEVGGGLRIEPGPGVERLDRLLTTRQPGVVIADTFSRFHAANENSASEMVEVFFHVTTLARHHGCIFVFLDHWRKKGLINDASERLRGSSAKRDWPDTVIAVEGDDADKDRATVSLTKQRHGEGELAFAVRREIDNERGIARLVYDGEAAASHDTKANDIIAAIHSVQTQLGPDGADAKTVAAWLNCSPDTVKRHAARLITAGILAQRTEVPSEKGGRPKLVYDVKGGHS